MARARPDYSLKMAYLPLDLSVLGLAAASLFVLITDRFVALEDAERMWLLYLDYFAILVFAVLFAGKFLASGQPVRYLKSHWFDFIGLLPITQPVFGLDRFWPVVGVIIVVARGSAALDRAFGDRVLARLLERYRAMLVEELTEPILVRLLAILRQALTKGRYMASIGESIEEKRADIHEVVRKSIAASPKLTFVRGLPGVDAKIREAVDEGVTSAVTALTSDEMDKLVRDAIDRALRDLEVEVSKPTWKEKGVTFGDIARGLTRGS